MHPDSNRDVPKKVIKYAKGFLGNINRLIETNAFYYVEHFPNSPVAKNVPALIDKHMLVDELTDEWIDKGFAGKAPSTVDGYRRKAKYIQRRFGEMRVMDVTDFNTEDWIGDAKRRHWFFI